MNDIHINLSPSPEQPLEVRPAPQGVLAYWRSRHEDQRRHYSPAIFVSRAAYESISRHVARTLDLEVGGMLVGRANQSPANGIYIVIEDILEAAHVEHSRIHLTFTSETLADMLNRLEELHPGKQIVGWYHTHPGLTVFLSSMDTWLHSHFFPQLWHVALVVDPQSDQGGFFVYEEGAARHLDVRRYVGFYELAEPGKASVVTWLNLKPEKSE